MRNLAFLSLVLVAVFSSSCASIKNGCRNYETVTLYRQDIRPMIEASNSLQTFDIEIIFGGKSVDGMLLIKKQTKNTVRVVINSYFGMSMMDFESSPHSFKVHYIHDALNKPLIVSMFKNDFQLLLGQNFPEQFLAQQSTCNNDESLITTFLSEKKHLFRITSKRSIAEIKAPWVKIKNIYRSDGRTIILKHTNIFSPDIIIKKNSLE